MPASTPRETGPSPDASDRLGPPRPPGAAAEPLGPDDERVEFKVSMSEAIGGPRGIVDSTLPTVAFVLVNSAAGLVSGVVAAAVVAVTLFVLRVARKEPKQQAVSGLFAVAVAGFVAHRTKSTKGYFLPSILKNAVGIVVGVASLALRRPIAGYVMAGFDARYSGWREHRDTMRAANWATGIWVLVYALRFGIQGVLYWAGRTGWLEVANLLLGLPLFGLAVLATIAVVRRLAPAARFAPAQPLAPHPVLPAGQDD